MRSLRIAMVLVALAGCSTDTPPGGPGSPGGSGSPGGGSGSGSGSELPPERGFHGMSALSGEPGGAGIWFVHDSVANIVDAGSPRTAHLGVYVPARLDVFDVLDTTGTAPKQILPLGNGRVLFATQRGTDRDVLVLLDAVARRPLAQRSYAGDRSDFRVSATGRAVIAVDKADKLLHLIDAATLFDQPLPATRATDLAVLAPDQDVLYSLRFDGVSTTTLQRYDLRTADLGTRIGPPEAAATINGASLALEMSPDGRYLAIGTFPSSDPAQLGQFALLDLVASRGSTFAADDVFGFTNDGRAILWRQGDRGHELVFVEPATGLPSAPVALNLFLPSVRPLRQHDLLVVAALQPIGEPSLSWLIPLSGGARTAAPGLSRFAPLFERPGHDELWVAFGGLHRLALATGTLDTVVSDPSDARSAVFRPDADEVVLSADRASLQRVSMATGAYIGTPITVTNPNDVAAPYRLTDD